MARKRGVPFRLQMMLRVSALVMALTAAFLFYVLDRVQDRVQQSGRENFAMLARAAFGGIDALVHSNLQYLNTVSRMLPAIDDLFSEKNSRALGESFLLKAGPNALTVVQPDHQMLYFLKDDIEAPPGTAYTEGHLRLREGQGGLISVRYHASDSRVIAHREISVDLHPAATEWNLGALRFGRYMSTIHQIPGRDSFAITMAARSGDKVVGLSSPLELIDQLLGGLVLSRNGAAVLIDERQALASLHVNGARWRHLDVHSIRLKSLTQIGDPVLAAAARTTATLAEGEISLVDLANQPFLLAWHSVANVPGAQYRLLLLAPLDDLSQIAGGARRDAWMVALIGLAIMLPLTWISTGAMSRVLQGLVRDSQRIGRMEFSAKEHLAQSSVREIQDLGVAHETMRDALAGRTRALTRVSGHLERLIDIGIQMGEKKGRKTLIQTVLDAARKMTGAQMGVLFLRNEDNVLRLVKTIGMSDAELMPAFDLSHPEKWRKSLAVQTVLSGITQRVDNLATDSREELDYVRQFSRSTGIEIRTAVSLLLHTHDQPVVGVMQVFNATDPDTGEVGAFTASQLTYLEALAAQVAVALEHHKLVSSQNHLLDTLVRTLGDAIDAKSEYTGRHCARVPELAMMLAREAHNSSSGPLADFAFHTDDQWREFRTGAWLHDCGKITTPEHVLDKATKLEMVYNRLHEIRTRFEVLLRDVRIEALEAQRDGRMSAVEAARFREDHERALHEDYAFIATCNIGSEHMSAEAVARVRQIAQRQWMRHFDDRLGLSIFEAALRPESAGEAMPVVETLLTDKPWHQVPRSTEKRNALTDGFNMDVPELLYDHGEVYNLCVERGTLTREERFKVNEHIIHTLRMLEGAQFPPHLRRVPEYAGTHHETLDGGGYPRGLKGGQLSIPARIMAIADIFEALTAADRPYKAPKPLSESLRILQRLKNRGQIDADLFALFLTSGVYLRYAERFLGPEQIDVRDVSPYLD